ncbi:hypothetical protein EYF80_027088 [Liparis tanakae]|uniref:Uncharacterized protein n=1 Tax=Liparis tanakae TaxID=230148 RepID=A0A4Z2H9S3_9TELE|nr:hypothetical protein EYF80_027088 [Liparis tanakae]
MMLVVLGTWKPQADHIDTTAYGDQAMMKAVQMTMEICRETWSECENRPVKLPQPSRGATDQNIAPVQMQMSDTAMSSSAGPQDVEGRAAAAAARCLGASESSSSKLFFEPLKASPTRETEPRGKAAELTLVRQKHVPQYCFIELLRPVGRTHYEHPVIPSRLHLKPRSIVVDLKPKLCEITMTEALRSRSMRTMREAAHPIELDEELGL